MVHRVAVTAVSVILKSTSMKSCLLVSLCLNLNQFSHGTLAKTVSHQLKCIRNFFHDPSLQQQPASNTKSGKI